MTILLVDDDPDDHLLIREALAESGLNIDLRCVEDGDELLDDLGRCEIQQDGTARPFPDVILLDLNMPRKDGLEALSEIRADSGLRQIPVVILTTSSTAKDIERSSDLGVITVIIKPSNFEAMVAVLQDLHASWSNRV